MGFERAEEMGFWEQSRREMMGKMERFCAVFDELGLPVRLNYLPLFFIFQAHPHPPPFFFLRVVCELSFFNFH